MSCKNREKDWMLYTSGDLEGRRRKRFDLHLAECEDCRTRLQAMESSRNLAVETLSDPVGMTRTEWAILETRLSTAKSVRRIGWVAALGAAAATVVVAVLLLRPGTGPSPSAGRDAGVLAPAPEAVVATQTEEEHYEMRMNTSDPDIKIVWVFDKNLNI